LSKSAGGPEISELVRVSGQFQSENDRNRKSAKIIKNEPLTKVFASGFGHKRTSNKQQRACSTCPGPKNSQKWVRKSGAQKRKSFAYSLSPCHVRAESRQTGKRHPLSMQKAGA